MAVKQESDGDHEFFTQMLDLIPTNFYFDTKTKKFLRDEESDDGSEEEEEAEAVVEKKPVQQKDAPNQAKKRASEELSLKAKWKRAKFDPAQIMTVSQMTEEIATKQAAQTPKEPPKKQKVAKTPESKGAASINGLRDKLKAKIELMKAKRHALDRKEEFQKRRLKRNEQKAKKKFRQKLEKQERTSNGPLTPKPQKTVAKPVFNKEGKMVYSKFDFSEQKAPKLEKKSYKALLEKAQKDKEKIETLKLTDKDAANNLKQKQQWQNVLQKAEGVRVKDNPELLKKAMKRKEQKQHKSKRDWQDRVEKVDTKIKQKQDKRTVNIKKKKEGRLNNKITKAKKKGRIAGF